jgi:leader peptidase (prepilin peptidase) / N-methyltransferase
VTPEAALRPLVVAWVALLGAAVGSFLNVVIARVPAGESVVHPRSRCPRCHAAIAWYDNLPLLSWVLLRGRCRGCRAPISVRYPVVEALGAAAALGAWARHGLGAAAAAELALVATLLALAAIDLDTWLLPNALTWPLIAAGLALSALGLTQAGALTPALYGAGLGFAAFALVAVVGERVMRREALGFGDVWLLAAIGAWSGVRALLPVVLLASVQGTVVGLMLLALGRGEPGPSPAPGLPVGTPPPDANGPDAAGAAAPGEPAAAGAPGPGEPAAAGVAGPWEPAGAAGGPPAGEPGPEAEEEWVPPRHAVPFGPFLVAGALEWLYLAGWIGERVPLLRVFT